ncbi:MAG: LysM peptidoglycan-binding domain-containing protein [Gammaproteobacteria bacterium]|nr:LysM peptidoglycan-binding domain-containing protein [Gammaproteobacteria bacterium]
MKKKEYAALLALPALALTTSLQAGSFEGYLTDSMGNIIHTPYGECIHTGFWNKSYAQPECDAILEIRSKYAVAVEVAEKSGEPIPAKPPEIVEMEVAKIEEPVTNATVKIGMPESADMTPEVAPMAAVVHLSEVEVSDGESLWSISANEQVYGSSELWPLLLCANREQIVDADLIYPGQQISIPQNVSAAAKEAAIQHADMRGEWELGEVEDSDLEYLAIHCNR